MSLTKGNLAANGQPFAARLHVQNKWLRRLRAALSRLSWMFIVVWASMTLTFVLSRVIPADPARLAAGIQAGPEQVEEVRKSLGLDQSLTNQYITYVSGIVRLDLGKSIQTRQPVLDDIVRYLPATLELVIVSFMVFSIFGIAIGVLWSRYPKSAPFRFVSLISVVGVAMPVFWIGLLLQLFFAAKLDLFPLAGNLPYEQLGVTRRTGAGLIDSALTGSPEAIGKAISVLVLPVTALVLSQFAVASRLTKASMDTEMQKLYVRSARARGVNEWRITIVDALRNALNPVVTMLGLQFG